MVSPVLPFWKKITEKVKNNMANNNPPMAPQYRRRKSRSNNQANELEMFKEKPTFDTPEQIKQQLMAKEISMAELTANLPGNDSSKLSKNLQMLHSVVEKDKGFLFGDDNIPKKQIAEAEKKYFLAFKQ